MASLHFHHNVKGEKANAMRRFRGKRMLRNMLRLFNICAALLVFSRSPWFRIVLETLCYLYAEFVALFNNSFYAFLLGNTIILLVYALSDHNCGSGDVYREFLNNSESRPKMTAVDDSPVTGNNPEEYSPEKPIARVESSDKQIIFSEVPVSQVFDGTVAAVSETTMTTTTCCTTVSRTRTANGEEVSEKKCYRIVRSESFERRLVVAPRRELKRLNTELSREPVRYGGETERRLCSVEDLSNEEFNRTVEDFIAQHKRMQWEEQRESQKTEYLALTQ